MRETEFIEQNKENWLALETTSKDKKDPEHTSELFVEVTNDLSYSKSYYPSRSIRVYLNNLAMSVHSDIYRTRQSSWKRIKTLWMEQIPRIFFEARWSVLIAALVFVTAIFIGVFSSSQDPGFMSTMFSQSYIDMTLENIAKGEPMAVYGTMAETDMFVYITFNNVYVAFRVFLFGLFFMIGTIGSMIFEGTRLGAFHYLFYEHGVLKESLLTVWMHGMPEISSIVLAGGAGIELGKGLIFPGTYLRKEAFFIGAKRGMMMMLGIVPVFILAGFVEGFITRHTDVNDFVRAGFILVNFGFIATYFFIMPIWKHRRKSSNSSVEDILPERNNHDYAMGRIKAVSKLFSDTFSKYSIDLPSYLLPGALVSIVYTVLLFLLLGDGRQEFFATPIAANFGLEFFYALGGTFTKVAQLFQFSELPLLYFINSLAVTVMAYLSIIHLKKDENLQAFASRKLSKLGLFSIVFLHSLIAHLVFFIPSPASVFFMFALVPGVIFFLLSFIANPDIVTMDARTKFKSMISDYMRLAWLVFLMFCCSLLFLIFFNSGFTDYLLSILFSNIKMEDGTYDALMVGAAISFTMFGLLMVVPLFVQAVFFSFWSTYEKVTASHLKEEIGQIGHRDRAYGMLRE